VAGAVRDILRLQFIFAGLDALTLAPPQPEIVFESVPIARVSTAQAEISRLVVSIEPLARQQAASVSIAREAQESIVVAEVVFEQVPVAILKQVNAPVARTEEQASSLTLVYERETER